MFARVTMVNLPEATSAAEILNVHERLYARLKRLRGFRDYIALINRETGEAKAIIMWESKADMLAHHKSTTALLSRIGLELNTTPQRVEEYEVAFHK
jgi:hypothetical protein